MTDFAKTSEPQSQPVRVLRARRRPGAEIEVVQTLHCEHIWDGEPMVSNSTGGYWKESELPTDLDLLEEFYIANRISGGCMSCSKCGKPFKPNVYKIP